MWSRSHSSACGAISLLGEVAHDLAEGLVLLGELEVHSPSPGRPDRPEAAHPSEENEVIAIRLRSGADGRGGRRRPALGRSGPQRGGHPPRGQLRARRPARRPSRSPTPGVFPFTRGNFPDGYRGRLWTFRQYSGFGTPEESNERYRYLLAQGGTGLSVALDLPTQCGYDSDHPDVEEEVGRVGVALDTLADAEILFDAIPLDQISTSFTINGTAAILLAFYVAVGEKQGVDRAKLRGTIQNDILKEYVSRGTWIWPPRPSLRLIADTIEFCARGGAAVQRDLRRRRALPRRRRERRAGDGVHADGRHHVLRRGAWPAGA